MAELIKDRVKETSTTTGTGSLTLGGAVTGYRTWSGAGFTNNDTGYYVIEHQSAAEWEVGLGTWTTGGVLVRTTPLAGSAATPVSFSAGTKHVFNSVPAAAYQTINDLTSETAPADADLVALYDASASTTDKVALSVLKDYIENQFIATAGSATAGSWMKLASGTVQTTPDVGSVEFDGNSAYFTPDAGNRGVWPAWNIIRQDSTYVLTSATGDQKLFNASTNGRLTLETGTYLFQCQFYISGLSATSGNAYFDILGAGSATVGTVLYGIHGADGNSNTAGTRTGSTSTNAQSQAAMVTAGTGTALQAHITGTFEVTAGGTIVPSIGLLTAAAGTVAAGSYFMCSRIGSTTLTTVGQWD